MVAPPIRRRITMPPPGDVAHHAADHRCHRACRRAILSQPCRQARQTGTRMSQIRGAGGRQHVIADHQCLARACLQHLPRRNHTDWPAVIVNDRQMGQAETVHARDGDIE